MEFSHSPNTELLIEDHIQERKEFRGKSEKEDSLSVSDEGDDRLGMLLERRRVDIHRRSFAQGNMIDNPRKKSHEQVICISGILNYLI